MCGRNQARRRSTRPAADSQHFIVNNTIRDESNTPITLVQNWNQRR